MTIKCNYCFVVPIFILSSLPSCIFPLFNICINLHEKILLFLGGIALKVASSSCLRCSFRKQRAISLIKTGLASSFASSALSYAIQTLWEGRAFLGSKIFFIFPSFLQPYLLLASKTYAISRALLTQCY